jgi:gamma-glutamyltranspeptidase/glutathione hydrolase
VVNPRTTKGVIAAGHTLTAQAGAGVLRNGGSAIDAAIAALTMACVAEPVLCSPGGGGFAMVREAADAPVSVIDFFPQTPMERRPDGEEDIREVLADFGTAQQAFHIGPGTTAAPGFFAGLEALHHHGATLPLDELFGPAIHAARRGITVTPFQHYLGTVVRPILTATPAAAALFAPTGDVLAAGSTFTNPGLADALSILAADGFATSEVGAAMLELQFSGGHLTAADLARYGSIERRPIQVRFGRSTVYLNPQPAAGGTLIEHSLERIDRAEPPVIARAFHESDQARQERRGRPGNLDPAVLRQQGTTHISVIDQAGRACSVTTSNGSGNGEIAGRFGFMPNNILGEDDVNPEGRSAWPTDTRLSSGMSPTIIEDDDGSLTVLGSGGSNRIRTAIAQVVTHLCLEGADLAEAISAPRLHVENGHLDFEDLLDPDVRDALTHQFPDHRPWSEPNLFYGGVHAARIDGAGVHSGAGDHRRNGAAIVVD